MADITGPPGAQKQSELVEMTALEDVGMCVLASWNPAIIRRNPGLSEAGGAASSP
jgi:hypothetical protein